MKRKNTFETIFLVLLLTAGFCQAKKKQQTIPVEPSGYNMSALELEMWNDPKFQKRFVESYIAETEIEPRNTVDEIENMQKIMEMISEEEMDEAAKKLEKLRDEASTAVYDFTLATIYFQQADAEEITEEQRKVRLGKALDGYLVAVDKYPKFRRAWRNMALIYVREGEYEKAIQAFTRVIELGGSDSVTYGWLGYSYFSVGNYLSAESAYRFAVLIDPVTMDWKIQLAKCLFKQERYHEAIALCEQLIKERPDNADLWLMQANAYIGLNQPLKVAEIYELVDQLGKSTATSLNTLADIYVNEELYGMAVDTYIRAMKMESVKLDRPLRGAKVLAAQGALGETRRLIENIENLHGDNLVTKDRKDLLKLRARIAVAEGAGDEEVRVLKEIVELDPLDGEALILLGQHSQRTGDPEKAVFYFERAAAIEKYEADAKVRHAQLLVGEGKYSQALPLLRRAQLLNPRENIQKYLEQVERVAKTN